MKQFDLALALSEHRVVDEFGNDVSQFHIFNLNGNTKLFGVVSNPAWPEAEKSTFGYW